MKLFKGHALIANAVDAHSYLIRTYVAIASTWQEARAHIHNQEPRAEMVTIPVEASHPMLVDARVISEREFDDLRAACDWNENQLRKGTGD